jgi:heme o synthase
MKKISMYYWLTKPGIVYGNTIAAMAGFFLASSSEGQFDLGSFLAIVIGIMLVIGSACVFNNYIDRGIDGKMKRTKWRATVSGKIPVNIVLVYGAILGVLGFTILIAYTNWLTVGVAALASVAYVVLYSVAKRKTVHGTLVGTISGALPPVIGYVAAANMLDMGALLLFVIMVCWQMPHFYAIAMRRRDEYAAAKVPVLPVVKGMYTTKVQIMLYTAGFIIANSLMVAYGYVGLAYLVVMTALGLVWLAKGIRGFRVEDDQTWARKMFLFSLVVLITWCFMISIGGLLP